MHTSLTSASDYSRVGRRASTDQASSFLLNPHSATALFSFPLANLSSSTAVTALDLGQPILDLSVVTSASTPTVIVSVDTPESAAPGLVTVSVGSDSVRPIIFLIRPSSILLMKANPTVIIISLSSQLAIVPTPSSLLTSPHLLSSPAPPPAPLEKKAGKTKAPRSPDGNFNLYQLLVEMPKWAKDGEDEEEFEDAEARAISKKETGRRKNNGGIPSLPLLGGPHKKRALESAPSTPAEEDEEANMMNNA